MKLQLFSGENGLQILSPGTGGDPMTDPFFVYAMTGRGTVNGTLGIRRRKPRDATLVIQEARRKMERVARRLVSREGIEVGWSLAH